MEVGIIVLACIIVLASVIGVFVFYLHRYYRLAKKLNLLPGFKSRLLIGDLPLISVSLPPGIPKNAGLSQAVMGIQKLLQNESLVKMWLTFLPYVLIYKAEAAEVLMSSAKEISKSREYTFFRSWLGLGLLTSTGAKWKSRRRLLTPTFHFRVLNEFQPVINEQCQILIQNINKDIHKDHIDVLQHITLCALDIICETAMGAKIHAQIHKDSPYIGALHTLSELAIQRMLNPLYWIDFVFNLTPAGRKYNKALDVVLGFTKEVIHKRILENSSRTPDTMTADVNGVGVKKRFAFLDLLIDEHLRNPDFTLSDIREEVDTFMFEGHDTTAVGLSWCVFALGHHPEIQEKLYQEITEIAGADKESSIPDNEIKEMKYLECVLKESLRLYPSVFSVGRKLQGDLSFGKKVVPAGTTCLVHIMAIHRDPAVFPDPEKFDPERFTPENSEGRHPYAFIPFAAGPRNCIGQKFAVNEEKTILANLVRNFSWVSLDPEDKVLVVPDMVIRPYPGHRVKFSKRV